MIDTSAPGYRPFKLSWSSLCLCGSGRKFRDCCHGRLAGTDITGPVRDAVEAGDWPKALLAARAAVTQYTVWHLSHTAPRHLGIMRIDERMLEIDLNALSAHVATLGRAYYRLNRPEQFLKDLSRLRTNIDDPRWARKIAYHRSVMLMVMGDRAGAGEALAEAGPVPETEGDFEIIQAHLDLNGEAIGFSERQALMRQIVKLSRERAHKLQYSGALAMELILIDDENGATERFRQTVVMAHDMEASQALEPIEERWLCLALEGLAVATRDEEVFDELVHRWRGLIEKSADWSAVGQADLWKGLADAYRYWDKWDDAIEAYREATELGAPEAARIFEAETLAWKGQADEALELLSELAHDDFTVVEEADFAFIWYFAANRARNREAMKRAVALLRETEISNPHFEKQRLKLLNSARDDLAALTAEGPPPSLSLPLRGLKTLSRYAMLQPNWNGVGLNFNLMIDDAVERAERRNQGSD